MDLDVRHVGGDDYHYDNQVPGMIIGHSYEYEVNSHTEHGAFSPEPDRVLSYERIQKDAPCDPRARGFRL